MLSHAAEDYLKAIHKLSESTSRVSNAALAEELGVTPPSVTSMIKQLSQLRLVRHVPYQGVELTVAGEKIALEVLRHHRIVELYLAEFLGYPWDRVHEEADRLEHVISPELEARMAEKLGNPTVDPHGDPIPTLSGVVLELAHTPLSEFDAGSRVKVRRVSDKDPEKLRYFAEFGLVPNAEVEIISVEPFGGPLVVRVREVQRALDRSLARTIHVSSIELPGPSGFETLGPHDNAPADQGAGETRNAGR
jgi:DtxR family transcriptional regulator, Mn-dependent transcriptional regulator